MRIGEREGEMNVEVNNKNRNNRKEKKGKNKLKTQREVGNSLETRHQESPPNRPTALQIQPQKHPSLEPKSLNIENIERVKARGDPLPTNTTQREHLDARGTH